MATQLRVQRGWATKLFAKGLAACIAAALIAAIWNVLQFGVMIDAEIDALAVADSDGLQWSLSQLEVEYHQILYAATQAKSGDPEALAALTRRFDIFYSRLNTVMEGRGFENVVNSPAVAPQIGRLRDYAVQTARLIDSGPQALAKAIGPVERATLALAEDVRALSLQGIREFAEHSKAQREQLYWSVVKLAALARSALAALMVLTAGLSVRWAYRTFQRRAPRDDQRQPRANGACAQPAPDFEQPKTSDLPPQSAPPIAPPAATLDPAFLKIIRALQTTRLTKKQTALLHDLETTGTALSQKYGTEPDPIHDTPPPKPRAQGA